jgi:hypothetical protein
MIRFGFIYINLYIYIYIFKYKYVYTIYELVIRDPLNYKMSNVLNTKCL